MAKIWQSRDARDREQLGPAAETEIPRPTSAGPRMAALDRDGYGKPYGWICHINKDDILHGRNGSDAAYALAILSGLQAYGHIETAIRAYRAMAVLARNGPHEKKGDSVFDPTQVSELRRKKLMLREGALALTTHLLAWFPACGFPPSYNQPSLLGKFIVPARVGIYLLSKDSRNIDGPCLMYENPLAEIRRIFTAQK